MAQYEIKARNTSKITTVPVTANTREEAITQVVNTAEPGEEMEILEVVEVFGPAAGATGATGP